MSADRVYQDASTVFIIDDDDAVRDGLMNLAESVGLNAEAFRSAGDFLDRYEEESAGCLILDVRLPGMSGMALHGTLRSRGIDLPVIMISGYADVPLAVQAVKAGVHDFLQKPLNEQILLDRIQEALEIDLQRRSRQSQLRIRSNRFETLTPREEEVMRLLVQGLSGKEIAAELEISYKTVEKFRGKVMNKMQAGSLADLVLSAVSLGLVAPDDEAA